VDARRRALARLRPYVERAARFSGSSHPVDTRELGPPLPWSYEALVRERAVSCASVLDLGTGGGERLSALRSHLPARVVATEGWAVNARVAHRRLQPFGVPVVHCSSLRLPFAARSFDLVVNRHEELDPAEVARVLRPGGAVVTQQVGRDDWCEIREFLPRMVDFGDLRAEYRRGFEAQGFEIVEDVEHRARVAFRSLGDVVYMLLVSPWLVPDLALEADLEALLALEETHSRDGEVVLTESRDLLVAIGPS
jgi:SAM-dependent methyltransferase